MDALDRTKDKLIEEIFGTASSVGELKGSKADATALNDGISYLRNVVYEDDSVEQSGTPWSMSMPVGFSVVAFTPSTITEAISGYVDRLDRPRVIQSFALDAILKPLVHPEQLDLGPTIDAVQVLLDSTTWEQPASDYAYSSVQNVPLELETKDSQSVPGIQLADLAAYAWRRNYTGGDCGTAAGVLHDLRFAR